MYFESLFIKRNSFHSKRDKDARENFFTFFIFLLLFHYWNCIIVIIVLNDKSLK